ncbi:hydroxyethylthiazole kinase [Sansalvadorimonas sp. 2012CJ34-2]|uniref:Hydroxyethylthiazole kinase n=1 Tax=Parendozoicomonas callyspongiae TaxID=2942213 RepID=A0ABT0PDX8_9GAMM|nr:hydroxyethylthiazole kinase [Sansalvadorimonas sp. 2012CJ34-2]MCL6269431.1 hydroxyethylthiazole kinase [Sansalvadorimonas sp. 2012CJ34-2]
MTLKETLSNSLSRLRKNAPLVHSITNSVVMNNTANALLALGASPIMSDGIEEMAPMVELSGSLVVNIGTLNARTVMAMKFAASHAQTIKHPWVLDPVGAGATRFRLDTSQLLLEYNPSVVKGNGSEILTLFAGEQGGRGVDSTHDDIKSLTQCAVQAARDHKTVIAATGETDIITDGHRVAYLKNGHPMMVKVTGSGCTCAALVGAFLATEDDPFHAAVAALACMSIAGQLACQNSRGPGSLQLNMLDELYNLSDETLMQHLSMEDEIWE